MFVAEQVDVSLDRCSEFSRWNRFFLAFLELYSIFPSGINIYFEVVSNVLFARTRNSE